MKPTLVLFFLTTLVTSTPLFPVGGPGSGCVILDGVNLCDSPGLETSGEKPIREGTAQLCKPAECKKNVGLWTPYFIFAVMAQKALVLTAVVF